MIYENNINNSRCGIEVRRDSKYNNIFENTITSCDFGITLYEAYNNSIYRNNIIDCTTGVKYTYFSYKNQIFENNFIDNRLHGTWSIYPREIPLIYSRNVWDSNYWGKPLLLPKLVKGYIIIRSMWYPYYLEVFPSFRIDWHPAQEPYDI